MTIKLICTDMDGTLLNDDHIVSEENKKALKYAVDKGVKIAITTGRLFTSAKYYSDVIGVNAPIISSNGAYIKEKDKDEVIYQETITTEEAIEIYDILSKYDITTYFNTFDTVISSEAFPEEYPYFKINKTLPEDCRVKLVVSENIKDYIKQCDGHILKAISLSIGRNHSHLLKAKEELKSLSKYEVVSSGEYNFEIMKKGTSKGKSVQKLAEILNIPMSEVMCIGDSENDLSMIKVAGVGVAMENGLQIIKDAATFTTDTNNNHGVAKAIMKYI